MLDPRRAEVIAIPSWQGRESLYFLGRWVVIVCLCALLARVLIMASAQMVLTPSEQTLLLTVFVLAGSINLLFLLFMIVPYLMPAATLIGLVGDVILVGLFAYTTGGESAAIIASVALMTVGLLRTAFRWNAFQILGCAVMGACVFLYFTPTDFASPSVPLVALFIFTAIVLVTSFGLDRQLGVLRRQRDNLQEVQNAQADDFRERTRALYELAFTMSATLNYEKILDAALEAGRLCVRIPARDDGQGLVGAVMLYHAEDNALHVVASRRFTRADDAQVIAGTEGIVGQAMKEAEPRIANDARRDAELQYFTAFLACRSILCIPLRSGFDNFGILVYGSEKINAFTDEHRDVLTAIGLQATLALQNSLLYRSLLEEKERIIEVEEDARKKLARDLHDGPTQTISAVAMRISYTYRLLAKQPDRVPEELKKVEAIARNATKEIRHMLFTLRPLVLETQGLGAALTSLAQKFRETHEQNVVVRMGRDVETLLDRNQQGVIFYIIEEAVNNARKHAQATQVSVTVVRQDDMAAVQISDNGVGFNTGEVGTNYESRGSLGMVNMRERAELLEGRLNVESVQGKGTLITVMIPLRGIAREPGRENGKDSGRRSPRSMTKLAIAAADRLQRMETGANPRANTSIPHRMMDR